MIDAASLDLFARLTLLIGLGLLSCELFMLMRLDRQAEIVFRLFLFIGSLTVLGFWRMMYFMMRRATQEPGCTTGVMEYIFTAVVIFSLSYFLIGVRFGVRNEKDSDAP